MGESLQELTGRSTPSVFEFSPTIVPFHARAINALDSYDFNEGYPEILLSGSIGSGKSLLAAHLGVRHCLQYPGATVAICRRALPDIKATIYQTIVEHLECEQLKEGRDFKLRTVNAEVEFSNGSLIKPLFWADKKWARIRSVALSAAIFEEITENNEEDKRAFEEIKGRIGRKLHVPEKFLIAATNPDEPTHWVAKYFISDPRASRFVFYSNSLENPFLPESYIRQLKADMNPKLAERLIYGQWVSIQGERLYYGYSSEANYRPHELNWKSVAGEVSLCFDFNIAGGKPMSSCAMLSDRHGDHHVFKAIGIESMKTGQVLEHWDEWGLFKGLEQSNRGITICGDAAGANRDTRGLYSDWDIIFKWLAQHYPRLPVSKRVPQSNPPVRVRQNIVNSLCVDGNGRHRLYVYKDAKLLDEGLLGTKAKKGSTYDEDDSFHAQHVVSALGYGLVAVTQKSAPITAGRY